MSSSPALTEDTKAKTSNVEPELIHHPAWVTEGDDVPAHLSYLAAAQVDHIQYGPLTAQGNLRSAQDEWPQVPTLPAEPVGEFDEEVPRHAFPLSADGERLPPEAWLTATESSLVSADYGMYRELNHVPFQDSTYTDTAYSQAGPPLLDDFPGMSMAHRTHSPYSGVWAFNPMAVDDNFVYPPNLPPTPTHTERQGPTSEPAATSAVTEATVASNTPLGTQSASFAATSNMVSQAFPASVPLYPPTSYVDYSHIEHNTSHVPVTTGIPDDSFPAVEAKPTGKEKQTPVQAKSMRPEKVKRNRAGTSQAMVPRRQGPLSTAQRQKADDMRYYGACWRCRRYKKPCNGPGTCDTCLTSGFRVWPSTIGCYRGNMEDFICGVMPGNAELVINGMNFSFAKVPNWKTLFGYRPDMVPIVYGSSTNDKYEALSIKLQATRMAGKGFVELLDVLANYQRSRTKPDTCLELVCSALNHICDIYHAFVETDTPVRLNAAELLSALTKFRTAYSDNWRHFLQLCLSGRRSAWFPAFLCACINVPLLVVLKDGFVAIPEPARTTLWPNISFLIEDLRNRLYPMGLDLLSALAKGIRPWKLRCWGWKERTEANGSITMERDPDGMRLLAGDVGAFDGFAAVQAWLAVYRVDMLDGVSFLTTPPFSERNAKMQPIAALAWIFEVNPPTDKERAIEAANAGRLVTGTA